MYDKSRDKVEKNGKKPKIDPRLSRRSVLASTVSIAGFSSIVSAGDVGTDDYINPPGGSSPPYTLHYTTDSESNDQVTGVLEDTVELFPAYAPFNDYWNLPFEFSHNAYGHEIGGTEGIHSVASSGLDLWSDDIDAGTNEKWVGGSNSNDDYDGTHGYDYAEDVIEVGVTNLPSWNWLMDVGLILGKMVLDYAGVKLGPDISREFLWSHGTYSYEAEHCSYWIRVEAIELDPGESTEVEVERYTIFDKGHNTRIEAQNEYTLYLEAPDKEPANAESLSAENNDIGVVYGHQLQPNNNLGIPPEVVKGLDPDQKLAIAPAKAKVIEK